MIQVLTIAAMAAILQYINASNPHTVHLKFTWCHMSNIFQLKNKIVVNSWEREELQRIPSDSTGYSIVCVLKKDLKQVC